MQRRNTQKVFGNTVMAALQLNRKSGNNKTINRDKMSLK